LANVHAHEARLAARLLAGIEDIPGARVQGTADLRRQVAVVSFTIEGWEPVDLGAALDSSFGVAVRAGLHCAPLAHRTLGTYPRGTVRLSPGWFTTEGEVEQALAALRELARAGR
jgi:selenocysteine lyase/cysteine desulfurase